MTVPLPGGCSVLLYFLLSSPGLSSLLCHSSFTSSLSVPLTQSFSLLSTPLPFSLSLSHFSWAFLLAFVSPSILFLSPYFSSWKTILGPECIWFDLEPLPHSSEPSIQPFLLGVPARSPGLFTVPCTPSSRSGLSFLLTDGRAVSSPSLKQHLIAVFCSWTSKLGLRRCAGSQCVVSEGEEVSE